MAGPPVDPSYNDAFAITPSDTIPLGKIVRMLYIGGTGDVTVVTLDGTTTLFKAVPVGTFLRVACSQVMNTGTSATNIVGLV